MARAVLVICFTAVVWPITTLADMVGGPSSPENYPLTAGVAVLEDEGSMFGSDVLPVGMAVPSDESGFLISPLPAEAYTFECLCTSAEFEPRNNWPTPAGSGVVDLPVVAQSEPATVELRPFLLAVILLGGLCHFLTSPYYAAFWNRLFGPLDWD